jgi:transglutaminase-like putative cysteine protease
MNRRFPLAPSEGWLTVGLVAVLCVTMAAAIDDVAPILARDDFTDLLVPMAILGMLAGLIGAKVGWGRWLTYLVGAVFAALIVPLAVGDLLVRNAPVPVENAGTLAAAYHETATSLVKAATDLLVLRSPSTNQFGHFILVMGLLVWGTAMFASFTVFRHGRPLNAIVVVGLVLLVNMSLTTRDQLVYLVVFSLASLFLLIRYHVLEEQAEWVRRRIGDPASISGVYLRGGTLFIVAAIGGSLLLTNVASSDPLRGAWGGLSGGLIELSHSIQGYLPMGDNSRSFGADFDPTGTRISGRWNPDTSLEVTIQLPADEKRPFYWRVTTFDKFALNSWRASPGAPVIREAGDALLDGSPDAPNLDPNVTQPVQFTVTPEGFTGRPILSPLTPFAIDQRAEVGLVGDGSFLGTIQRDDHGPYTVTALIPIKGNDPGQLNEENLRSAGTDYPVEVTNFYLDVPPGAMPAGGKAQELYDQLVAEAPSLTPFDFALFLQDRFQDSGPDALFQYDANLFDLLSGPCKDLSSVECFAAYRRGYCQYYASTMAIFLREQGIPSRIVEGFLPGKRTVRGEEPILNSQSHQWVEVYFPGYGWVPFDPTGGSVAQLEALPSGPPVAGSPRPAQSFALPSRPVGDGINEPNDGTNPGVVGTNSPAGPLIGMAVLLAVIVGALAFVAWQRGPRNGTTADHAYRTVTRLASRFGFGPRPTQTVYEFSGSLGEVLPIARPQLELVARAKVETSYGRGVLDDERLRALRDAERRLKLNMFRLVFRRRDRRRR